MPYLLPTSDIYSIYLNNSRLTLRTALWRSAIRCDPGLTLSNSSLLFLGGQLLLGFLVHQRVSSTRATGFGGGAVGPRVTPQLASNSTVMMSSGELLA